MAKSIRQKSRSDPAFALTELLVVMAIIALVSSLMVPALMSAKRQARVSDNLSRLRSCHLAIALYRNDHEAADSTTLGLPHIMDILTSWKREGDFYGSANVQWKSACAPHPFVNPQTFTYFPSELDAAVRKVYAEFGEQTILLADNQCTEPDVDASALFTTKLGMGVLVDGTLLRRRRQGLVDSFLFWHTL